MIEDPRNDVIPGRTVEISAEGLLRRLIAVGITTPAALVRDGGRIHFRSSRHRNFRLIDRCGRGWFLKQGDRRSGLGSVAHETRAYRALQACVGSDPPIRILTAVAYDEDTDLLVIELVPDARDLAEIVSGGEPLNDLPAKLGRALAALHTLDIGGARARDLPVHRGTTLFELEAPSIAKLTEFSRAQIELTKVLQTHEALLAALSEMQADWRAECLIHFDVRLANVLVGAEGPTLVDLEFLGVGDPRWDVGSLLGSFLEACFLSAPLGDPEGFDRHLDLALFTWTAARSAIRERWAAYAMWPGAPRIAPADAARFAGARLIQAAYEQAASLLEPNARVATLAALGVEVLSDPQGAAREQLGIAGSAATPLRGDYR